jgi:AcrR family transcriptional regulator
LIFYHFGSVTDLLLAALDEVSDLRLSAYGQAVEAAVTLEQFVDVASHVYQEDLASGYVKVLVEMIAGAGTSPELLSEVSARLRPWFDFTQSAVDRSIVELPLTLPLPTTDIAYAIVALFLGLELLTHLERDTGRAGRLFTDAKVLASLLSTLSSHTSEASS